MSDMISFWLAQHVADMLVVALFVVIVVIGGLLVSIPQMIRQARCKHDGGVNETSAYDAICRQCGKNLGFIGAWRERQANK